MPLSALSNHLRKSTGAYYTPPELIQLLLSHALPPTSFPLKILDPACGPGDFLLAAHHRAPAAHLFGIDINPTALAQCQASLHHSEFSIQNSTLAQADALLSPPPFLQPQSFDLILGNPPYVNAIEGNLTANYKSRLRPLFPNIKGAADLAHYFLDQATRLVRTGGRIAFVLPRAILNSPAAARLRANLPTWLKPNLIYAPERHDFFPGAAIFICLLILGPDELCQISTDPNPATATFHSITITNNNWWLAISPLPGTPGEGWGEGLTPSSVLHPPSSSSSPPTLGAHFQLSASMTTADAYDLIPHLIDDPHAPGPKLITTGLIEPRQCLWGQAPCRYLKKDYQHPRLTLSPNLTHSLATRAQNAKRPKILLAGLAKKIEAFLDPTGQYIGAVSTYSIYHPQDNLQALDQLLNHLLSPPTTQHLIHHLGANALRGKHITLKKQFLQSLPLPQTFLTSVPPPLAGSLQRP
jgi:SAM-dependent methyltransferase